MGLVLRLLGGALGPYIASAIAMLVVGLTLTVGYQSWRIDRLKDAPAREVTKVVTKIEKADAKEVIRREEVVRRVQVRSQADIAKIDKLATKLVVAQEESIRASQAHNLSACLPADSVVRLAAVR